MVRSDQTNVDYNNFKEIIDLLGKGISLISYEEQSTSPIHIISSWQARKSSTRSDRLIESIQTHIENYLKEKYMSTSKDLSSTQMQPLLYYPVDPFENWTDTAPLKPKRVGRIRVKARSIKKLAFKPTLGEFSTEDFME